MLEGTAKSLKVSYSIQSSQKRTKLVFILELVFQVSKQYEVSFIFIEVGTILKITLEI